MRGVTPTAQLDQAIRVCELEGKAAGNEAETINSLKSRLNKPSGAAAGFITGLTRGLEAKRAKEDATELCLAKYGYTYQ